MLGKCRGNKDISKQSKAMRTSCQQSCTMSSIYDDIYRHRLIVKTLMDSKENEEWYTKNTHHEKWSACINNKVNFRMRKITRNKKNISHW